MSLAASLLEDILEYVAEPPERNCSCYISPPCHDCVEHSHLRELLENARAFIKEERERAA